MYIKKSVKFVRLVFETKSTLWYYLRNLLKIKYFCTNRTTFNYISWISVIDLTPSNQTNHKIMSKIMINQLLQKSTLFAQKSRWSEGRLRFFGYHLYLSIENNCENLKKIVRLERKPGILLKRLLLLQFWSDLDQSWYIWSLGRCTAELCSDKKLDPQVLREGHLRG